MMVGLGHLSLGGEFLCEVGGHAPSRGMWLCLDFVDMVSCVDSYGSGCLGYGPSVYLRGVSGNRQRVGGAYALESWILCSGHLSRSNGLRRFLS